MLRVRLCPKLGLTLQPPKAYSRNASDQPPPRQLVRQHLVDGLPDLRTYIVDLKPKTHNERLKFWRSSFQHMLAVWALVQPKDRSCAQWRDAVFCSSTTKTQKVQTGLQGPTNQATNKV